MEFDNDGNPIVDNITVNGTPVFETIDTLQSQVAVLQDQIMAITNTATFNQNVLTALRSLFPQGTILSILLNNQVLDFSNLSQIGAIGTANITANAIFGGGPIQTSMINSSFTSGVLTNLCQVTPSTKPYLAGNTFLVWLNISWAALASASVRYHIAGVTTSFEYAGGGFLVTAGGEGNVVCIGHVPSIAGGPDSSFFI